jgi:hypothetical protein
MWGLSPEDGSTTFALCSDVRAPPNPQERRHAKKRHVGATLRTVVVHQPSPQQFRCAKSQTSEGEVCAGPPAAWIGIFGLML